MTRRQVIFLAAFAVLTLWILVGREVSAEPVFTASRNAGYAAVLLLGVLAFRDGFVRSWRLTRARPVPAVGMVFAGLALMGVASGIGQLVLVFGGAPGTGANQAAISSEMAAASSSLAAGLLFVGIGGVVAPIVEELVFRAFALTRRRRPSTWVAFALSSLLFGVMHLRGWDEWPFGALYVGYAVALASVYLLSGRNLLVPVLTHVLWNGIGLTWLLVRGSGA